MAKKNEMRFGTWKRDENGEWKRLLNEELHGFYSEVISLMPNPQDGGPLLVERPLLFIQYIRS